MARAMEKGARLTVAAMSRSGWRVLDRLKTGSTLRDEALAVPLLIKDDEVTLVAADDIAGHRIHCVCSSGGDSSAGISTAADRLRLENAGLLGTDLVAHDMTVEQEHCQ